MAAQKFYVIEHKYVGPNQDQDDHIDADTIEISTEYAITNSSHEKRTEGWCGTTNDWAIYAHGEFDTVEEATAALRAAFEDEGVRDATPDGDDFYTDDENVVAVFKPGKYAPMTTEGTGEWLYDGMRQDIDADTHDEDLVRLADEYIEEARSQGYELADIVLDIMESYRQELRDERDED